MAERKNHRDNSTEINIITEENKMYPVYNIH